METSLALCSRCHCVSLQKLPRPELPSPWSLSRLHCSSSARVPSAGQIPAPLPPAPVLWSPWRAGPSPTARPPARRRPSGLLSQQKPEPTGLSLKPEDADSGSKSQEPPPQYSPVLKKEQPAAPTQKEGAGEPKEVQQEGPRGGRACRGRLGLASRLAPTLLLLSQPPQPPRPKPPVRAKPQLPPEVYTSPAPRPRPAPPPKPSVPIYQEPDEPIAFYAMGRGSPGEAASNIYAEVEVEEPSAGEARPGIRGRPALRKCRSRPVSGSQVGGGAGRSELARPPGGLTGEAEAFRLDAWARVKVRGLRWDGTDRGSRLPHPDTLGHPHPILSGPCWPEEEVRGSLHHLGWAQGWGTRRPLLPPRPLSPLHCPLLAERGGLCPRLRPLPNPPFLPDPQVPPPALVPVPRTPDPATCCWPQS